MRKDGRNRHRTKGGGGPGSPASAPQSLSAFRADRAVDALTPAFVRWFEDVSPGSAVAALECLDPIKAVLGRYMDTTAAADVTNLEPSGLSAAVSDEILSALDDDDGGGVAGAAAADVGVFGNTHFVVHSIGAFVEFLVETGRWSGSGDQLAAVMDFLDTKGEDDGGRGLIDVPDIPDEAALAVFSELPLIRRATALLEWIGEGKPVTATGALRLRDIEAAAACVGVAARGGTKRSGSPLPGTAGSPPPGGSVATVRSMYGVPLLARLWNALEAAEFIRITPTKVVPSSDSRVFLAGGPSERLQELVFFVDEFLDTAVLGWDPAQPWERTLSGLQASLLLAAATSDPPEKARVLAAADNAPPAERAMAGLLTGVAISRLEDLAELGLLTIDTHLRVPPAIIRCIANVFDDDWLLADLGIAEAADAGAEAGVEPTGQGPAGAGATFPAPALTAVRDAPRPAGTPMLQLKITLNDSKPPIWRRVLVPAGMPLPQLHQVIQAVFGWLDYHLHEFRVGGFRGTVYAPVNPDGDDVFSGEASRDESTATVGALLPAAGSSMGYTYDFGDNWMLAITVEKVLADDGGQLPRCTAGRGMAPAEDSGGTWGWANIVQAVNDPHHEDHTEYREWLGMLPGDTLDPKAFNVEEANQDLADFLL